MLDTVSGIRMNTESAFVSLLGDRQENQDRVAVLVGNGATLLLAVDGMGGHADGERAAARVLEVIQQAFRVEQQPVFDVFGFLHRAISRAHAAAVELGAGKALEVRPRATCAVCLVQDGASFWAHAGDSRVYQLRDGRVLEHTRDHSHVEVLLYEGRITRDELRSHPMRNYVECCLGGDAQLPRMAVGTRRPLRQGDVLLACTDGFWGTLDADELGALTDPAVPLEPALGMLADTATRRAAPQSDNTSVAALRYTGK